MAKLTQEFISQTVDALGRIKAQASKLAEQEKALKETLIDAAGDYPNADGFNGSLFRATVSEYEQETVDKQAVISKLEHVMDDNKAFNAFIKRNTETKSVVKVLVKARIADAVPVAA